MQYMRGAWYEPRHKMGNSETSVKDEELAIQIYEIVHTKYPEYSEKITGMILESDSEELRTLILYNEEELWKRIKMAATVVLNENKIQNARKNTIPDSCVDIDLIGNKLYGIVHQLYPVFAGNITGMLLEMDINRLRTLVNDNSDELMECIYHAAHVYAESQAESNNAEISKITPQSNPPPNTDVNTTSQSHTEQDDKQTLGEQIYLKIVAKYPDQAEKLTGMILEMNTKSLKELVADSNLFETKLSEALLVLHKATTTESGIINGAVHDLEDKETDQQMKSLKNNVSSTISQEESELERHDLAEQLYLKIVAKHPSEASKITGMFLEMDLQSLKELNENTELLNRKLYQSVQVLSEFQK